MSDAIEPISLDDSSTGTLNIGLVGPTQKRMLRLVDAINKELGPIVEAEFSGERVMISAGPKTIWLDPENNLVGASCMP